MPYMLILDGSLLGRIVNGGLPRCQGEGRRFEPGVPLQVFEKARSDPGFFISSAKGSDVSIRLGLARRMIGSRGGAMKYLSFIRGDSPGGKP